MPQFIAFTSRGLHDVLQTELHRLGIAKTQKTPSGVVFESNWQGCYRANLHLRSATRVVLPILDFPAYSGDDLYFNVLKKHDFTKYLGNKPGGTLAVEASVSESRLRDQRFVALKVKDAIVDQFRNKLGYRPDIDVKNADLRVWVRVANNQVSIAIDTSGEALFRRGYRKAQVKAPLKEHVAAGLLLMSGWDGQSPVVDPMCGSGTILIEAALMAHRVAPGTFRDHFAFQNFATYRADEWDELVGQAVANELPELPFQFYGFDEDRMAVKAARTNVAAAGLSSSIQIQRRTVDQLTPPCPAGVIITNPPYGERLGSAEVSKDSYRDLSYALKNHFKGWTCWLLSGNAEYTEALRLKSRRRCEVFNGPIECRFLAYEIR